MTVELTAAELEAAETLTEEAGAAELDSTDALAEATDDEAEPAGLELADE